MRMAELMRKVPGLSNATDGGLEYQGERFDQILINGEPHEFINAGSQFPMRLIRADVMSFIEIIPAGSPQYNNDRPILNIITSRPLPRGVAVETRAHAATDNAYRGGVDLVSNIRNVAVLRFGYDISYAKPQKLNSYSLRENLANDGSTISTNENTSQFWSDRLMHNFTLRGSVRILNRPLNFGVGTSLGENNVYTNLQNTFYDDLDQTSLSQIINTTTNTKTLPSLNGDFRWMINVSPTRSTNLLYRYDDRNNEMTGQQAIFETPFPQPAQPNSQNAQTRRTHFVQWFDNKLIGDVKPTTQGDFSVRGGLTSGHRVRITARYTNTYFDNMTEYYRVISRIEGMNYSQNAVFFQPGYVYNTPRWSMSTDFAFNYENYKGRFYGTQSPLDFSQLAFNPLISFTWGFSPTLSLGANYRDRTVRPSLDALNPFVDDTDPMNLLAGNPELKSERVRSLELNLNRRFVRESGRINVGLIFNYQTIPNAIERVTIVGDDGISLTTFKNINRSERYSIGSFNTLSFPRGMFLIGSVGYNIFVYHNQVLGMDKSQIGGFTANLRFDRRWKRGTSTLIYFLFPSEGAGQNTEFANSFTQISNGASQINKMYYVHSFRFGHIQELVKNKLFGSVEIRNPFESRQTVRSEITGSNFRMESWREQMGRTFMFSLRWNFGRLKDRVPDAATIQDDTVR
jgi:hypothetical protein